MENEFGKLFLQGLQELGSMANLGFMVINILWVLILRFLNAKIPENNKVKKVTIFKWVPKGYFVIFQSLVLAIVWAYLSNFTEREQFKALFIAITFAMIIYKLGIETVVKKYTKL